jgi:dipeptidyl-peptidase 4
VIRQLSFRLQAVFVLSALSCAIQTLIAQQPQKNSLAIEHIAEERDRAKALPENLVWSPDGRNLGYIRTVTSERKGTQSSSRSGSSTREIWSIDAASGRQQPLVSASELAAAFEDKNSQPSLDEHDDSAKRRLLKEYAWIPGRHALLLVSSVSITLFDLDAHSSKPLVTGGKELSNPRVSPDGRMISFIQDHSIWLADTATGTARAWTDAGSSELREGEPDWAYRQELGLLAAYWWSPDSSSIVWLETDDHAVDKYALRNADGTEQLLAYPKPGGAIPVVHLFVRTVSGGKPVRIDLGSDANVYIPSVQWLPDGKHLAIERLSRDQKTLDLLVADAGTGSTQTVLTDTDAYWINLSDSLIFLKDSHRFLWTSERSGYRHLYLYDISGKQLAQLTRGNWEVTSLAGVDETAGAVYFTATEASPLERQLYRVKTDGSGFTRITQQKGTHNVRLSPSGDCFLDTWSNHLTRPRHELLRVDGSKVGPIGDNPPVETAADQPSHMEFLTIKTHLGADMNALRITPPNFDAANPYPVIFYVAGGPGEQTVRDAWGGDIFMWFDLMAQNGYVVFAVDNRGSAGHGHLYEEPIHLRFSASEMADVRDGVMYLRSQPWADKSRLGVCGWGYGGFLAVHGMLDRPLMFKAGFAGSPVTDWHLYDAVFAERYIEDPTRNQHGWLSSSPLDNARNLNGPLLLAQATLNEKTHVENSLMLMDALLEKGKYADMLLFPNRRDIFEDRASRKILFQRLTDFFSRNL